MQHLYVFLDEPGRTLNVTFFTGFHRKCGIAYRQCHPGEHDMLPRRQACLSILQIFRCWVIYARSWYIIGPPLLLWFTFLVSSIISAYYSVIFGHAKTFKLAFWAGAQAFRFVTLLFASDIATNIYTTCTSSFSSLCLKLTFCL